MYSNHNNIRHWIAPVQQFLPGVQLPVLGGPRAPCYWTLPPAADAYYHQDSLRSSSTSSDDTIEVPRNQPLPQTPYYTPYQPVHNPASSFAPLHFPTPPPPTGPPLDHLPAGSSYESLRSAGRYQYPHFDGHYSNDATEQRRRARSMSREIRPDEYHCAYHYCYRCGRARSKRYHQVNQPTGHPFSGLCGRCMPHPSKSNGKPLVDDSSSSSSSSECDLAVSRKQRKNKAIAAKSKLPSETSKVSSKSLSQIKNSGERKETVIREVIIHKRDKDGKWSFETSGPKTISVIQGLKPTAHGPKKDHAHMPSSSDESTCSVHFSYDGQKGNKPAQDKYPTAVRPVSQLSNDYSDVTKYHVRVHSQSQTPDDDTAVAQQKNRCDIDRRIASHPNAWSHGRMVIVDDPRNQLLPPQRMQQPKPAPTRQHHPSPPDQSWYYVRRVVKLAEKIDNPASGFVGQSQQARSKQVQSRDEGTSPGSSVPPKPYRVYRSPSPPLSRASQRRKSGSDEVPPPAQRSHIVSPRRLAPPPPSEQSTLQQRGNPSQRERPPAPPAPREYYEAERKRRQRWEGKGGRSSDSDVHRVHFAPSSDTVQALRRDREAGQDRREAARDLRDFDHAKRRVEHKVIKKGAGPFEVDGAWSDIEEEDDKNDENFVKNKEESTEQKELPSFLHQVQSPAPCIDNTDGPPNEHVRESILPLATETSEKYNTHKPRTSKRPSLEVLRSTSEIAITRVSMDGRRANRQAPLGLRSSSFTALSLLADDPVATNHSSVRMMTPGRSIFSSATPSTRGNVSRGNSTEGLSTTPSVVNTVPINIDEPDVLVLPKDACDVEGDDIEAEIVRITEGVQVIDFRGK